MKYHLLIALGAALLSLSANAAETAPPSETSQVCFVDRTTSDDGKTYSDCSADPENNALLTRGFVAARIGRLQLNTKQPIWVHGVCKFVDNKGDMDAFIPFKTADEWNQYLKHLPQQMVTANCCEPRALAVSDIVTPPLNCAAGWRFLAIRDADGNELMRPAGSALIGGDGQPVQLPLLRDDENAVFKYGSHTEMTARFVCAGGPPPADPTDTGVPVPPNPDEDLTQGGPQQTSVPGEIVNLPLTVRCKRGTWKTYSALPCRESENIYTVSCANYGGGNGQVTIRARITCPNSTRHEEIVSNTCTPPEGAGNNPPQPNPEDQVTPPSDGRFPD